MEVPGLQTLSPVFKRVMNALTLALCLTSASGGGIRSFTELLLRCWRASKGFLRIGSAFATIVALSAAMDVLRTSGAGRGGSGVSAAGEGGLYAGLANNPASSAATLRHMEAQCLALASP